MRDVRLTHMYEYLEYHTHRYPAHRLQFQNGETPKDWRFCVLVFLLISFWKVDEISLQPTIKLNLCPSFHINTCQRLKARRYSICALQIVITLQVQYKRRRGRGRGRLLMITAAHREVSSPWCEPGTERVCFRQSILYQVRY